jgi:hypothetical protein
MRSSLHPIPVLVAAAALLPLVAPSHAAQADPPTATAVSAAAGRGTTYYVSGSGSDRRSGLSVSRAFRTLQHAADLTKPGDTVVAMDGRYTSPPATTVLNITTSGTRTKWITYRAYPGQTPTIRLRDNWGGIGVDGAAYIVVDGFTVVGNARSVTLAEARAQKSNLDNRRTTANGIGVATSYADPSRHAHHVTIRNNTVSHCPGGGIYANNADYLRIVDNVAHHNAFWSPYANSGISVYQNWNSDRRTATKVWIRRNVSYANRNRIPFYFSDVDNPAARVITDGNGIIVDDGRNTQSFGGVPGTPYTGRTLVENNVVHDNGGRGVNVFSTDHVDVRFNTSFRNARSRSITSELSVGDARDVRVLNNIIDARPDRLATLRFNTRRVVFGRNLFFGGTDSPPRGLGNRVGRPRFVSASSANFRLRRGSPAIDAARGTSPGVDVEGTPRPRGRYPDIGAFESR